MSNTTPRKRKAPQFYISILFIFSTLTGMLSSCGMVTKGVDFTLTPTVENPATEELTLVPETEVATQMPTIITLISEPTKTDTLEPTAMVEATSVKFSEKYAVTWSESYIGKVGDIEMPIDIGLTSLIQFRPEEPITEILLAPDIPDLMADDYLHACFLHYSQIMGYKDVTYDQYKELLIKGEGKIEFVTHDTSKSGGKAQVVTIDPLNGFSLAFAEGKLPISIKRSSFYFSSNEQQRLLITSELSTSYIEMMKSYPPENFALIETVRSVIRSTMIFIAQARNSCLLRDDYTGDCGLYLPSSVFLYEDNLSRETERYFRNERGFVLDVKQ